MNDLYSQNEWIAISKEKWDYERGRYRRSDMWTWVNLRLLFNFWIWIFLIEVRWLVKLRKILVKESFGFYFRIFWQNSEKWDRLKNEKKVVDEKLERIELRISGGPRLWYPGYHIPLIFSVLVYCWKLWYEFKDQCANEMKRLQKYTLCQLQFVRVQIYCNVGNWNFLFCFSIDPK